MLMEIGFGLVFSSCITLISKLSFKSFDRRRQLASTCKTLGLSVTYGYGQEVALPIVNAEYEHSWGYRLLVGLPAGLSSAKVMDQKQALSESLRVNPDDVEMSYDNGLKIDVFTVPMPDSVPFDDAPESPGCRVFVGVNRRGERRYYDFDGPYPHLLIAGISGGGKSVLMRSILASLTSDNGQELYLCDLKGGVELGLFRNLKCVKGFATSLNDVLETACAIEQEMARRYTIMAAEGLQLWGGPKALLVIDELADFKTRAGDPEAKLKNAIKTVLTRLSAKGRAAGVLLLLATQRPSADVVDGLIKTNIAASICFRTRDAIQSRIVLDHDGAAALPEVPGRMIFQTGRDEVLQAPFLSATDAKQIIQRLPQKTTKELEVEHHVVHDKPNAAEGFSLDGNIAVL